MINLESIAELQNFYKKGINVVATTNSLAGFAMFCFTPNRSEATGFYVSYGIALSRIRYYTVNGWTQS